MKEPPYKHNGDYLEKSLPSNEDSEKIIIGAVLLDNGLIAEVQEKLIPADFYSPLNKRIVQAMLNLFNASKIIDPTTIIEEMKTEGPVDSMGGISTIANYTHGLPFIKNITHHVDIVKDKSVLRQIIRQSTVIGNRALSEEQTSLEVLETAEKTFFDLNYTYKNNGSGEFVSAGTVATQAVDRAHEAASTGKVLLGISTGLLELDAKTLGLRKQDLIIIAGRPSMGKTALAFTVAQNVGIRDDNKLVAVFSLEMSREQCGHRMICSEAMLDSTLFGVGQLTPQQWEKAEEHRQAIANSQIYIDDTPAISPSYIRAKARRLIAWKKKPIDLIVVDYLQLMSLTHRTESRQQEVSKISSQLKQLSKEFDCPLIALSQLSRKPEDRKDSKPILSDLRESGSIEQDADVVLLMYREGYYDEGPDTAGIAQVIVGKQRNGPCGVVNLMFHPESTAFRNLETQF